VDVYIHVFLTSALVGDEWSASRLCRFTPGERALGTLIGGWVDPQILSGRHGEVKILEPTRTRTQTSHLSIQSLFQKIVAFLNKGFISTQRRGHNDLALVGGFHGRLPHPPMRTSHTLIANITYAACLPSNTLQILSYSRCIFSQEEIKQFKKIIFQPWSQSFFVIMSLQYTVWWKWERAKSKGTNTVVISLRHQAGS
jgi:hypothetical protein